MNHDYLFPELSEDQRMILDSVQVFCAGELSGRGESIDHEAAIAPEVLEQLAELGLLVICIPEEQGGAGFDHVSYQASLMEMAQASASCALHVALQTSGFLEPIARGGSAEDSIFGAVATGEMRGALAIQEDAGGFEFEGIKTSLRVEGDSLVLDGMKQHVLGGVDAGAFLVFAREGDALSAVLVPADADGLARGESIDRMGMRGVSCCSLSLNGVKVSASHRVGAAGQGQALLDDIVTRLGLALASIGVGLMRAARDSAARYATERRQFKRPISDFDAMRDRLATAEIGQASVLGLAMSAARGLDEGRDVAQLAMIARAAASEFAMKAADDALQVFGGYGYSQEYPAERIYRDARYLAVALGGTDQARREIAARILPE